MRHRLIIIPESGGPFNPKDHIEDNMVLTDTLIEHLNLNYSEAMASCPSVRRNSFYPKTIRRIFFNDGVISKVKNITRTEILWTFPHLVKNWPEYLKLRRQNCIILGYLSVDDSRYPIFVYFDNSKKIYICDDNPSEFFQKGLLLLPTCSN